MNLMKPLKLLPNCFLFGYNESGQIVKTNPSGIKVKLVGGKPLYFKNGKNIKAVQAMHKKNAAAKFLTQSKNGKR